MARSLLYGVSVFTFGILLSCKSPQERMVSGQLSEKASKNVGTHGQTELFVRTDFAPGQGAGFESQVMLAEPVLACLKEDLRQSKGGPIRLLMTGRLSGSGSIEDLVIESISVSLKACVLEALKGSEVEGFPAGGFRIVVDSEVATGQARGLLIDWSAPTGKKFE